MSPVGWLLFAAFAVFSVVLLPVLHLLPGADSALRVPDFAIPLLGKFLCYAMVALAVDLIWGYAGILSLGHGTFFALGGYAMGMYLMRSIGTEGVYRSELPDFMVFLDWKELPWFWWGFDRFGFVWMTVKAALARAVVRDAIAPVAGRHFAAVDFDCGASDFGEPGPRSTLGGFVFLHVNCAICVARIAP